MRHTTMLGVTTVCLSLAGPVSAQRTLTPVPRAPLTAVAPATDPAQIAALQAQVTALQAAVQALQLKTSVITSDGTNYAIVAPGSPATLTGTVTTGSSTVLIGN